MSFYRTILAAAAALVIASPVFANDDASTSGTENSTTQTVENSTTTTTTSDATTTETKVNINTATAKDLMKVKGLNASKARAIVAYRKKHGNFTSTDDLANVKGFKKMNSDTMKSITEQLTIE